MRTVGPEWGTGRNGAKKEDLICMLGNSMSVPTAVGGRGEVRVLCCCYQLEYTTADCTASKLAFIWPLHHGGTMNPRRLRRCLSLSHLGWAGQAGGEGEPLFLELLSPPYWFDLLSPYISVRGNLMLYSHLA